MLNEVDHLAALDEDPLAESEDHLAPRKKPSSPLRPLRGIVPPSTPTEKSDSRSSSWLPRWALRKQQTSKAAAIGSPSSNHPSTGTDDAGTGAGGAKGEPSGAHSSSVGDADAGSSSFIGGDETASFVRRRKQRNLAPQALKEIEVDQSRAHMKVKTKALTEQSLYEVIKSLLAYVAFLLIFLIVAFSTRSSDDFWANEAMKQVFVDGPFFFGGITHEKKLEDVHFTGQFFDWLQGPFLERVSEPELGSPPRHLRGYNRIIGPVRLRQLRVRAGTCAIPAMFKGTIDQCYAPYSLFRHDTEPFGPESAPQKWTYSSSSLLDGLIASGRFATYSGGGYVVDLPTNVTAAAATLEGLKQHGWIDRATRAVFVDMSCYNANTESFISVRLLFEFLPTGGILPYPKLRVLRPLLYTKPYDFFRAFFEVLFTAYVGFYIFQESRELRHARREKRMDVYWGDKWNVLDWIVALLSLTVILLRVYVFAAMVSIYRQIGEMVTGDEYINMQPVMFLLEQVQNLNAVNALLLFVKVFKYLAVIPQMNLLFGTLAVAGLELVLFSILFSIVILGFAMSFYQAFGLDVHGFRSVSASLMSLFQFVLGIFDYDELWASNRILAPVFFSAFAVIVILILMNIFLAIINDSFNVVSERQKAAQSLTGLFKALLYKKVLRKQFTAMMDDIGQGSSLLNSEELMAKMDVNGDAYLDAGELEELLRKTRLYEHFTVKELIQRFDSDGDGKLSGQEVTSMNEALLRKRRQVDMQLAAQLSPRTRSKVASIFASHQTFDNALDAEAKVNGALYTNELREAIEEMGYQISEEQLKTLMAEFDADGSSALDLLEFTALMARMLGYRELPEEQFKLLRKVFAYVDSDGDGRITPAELRAVVERFGLKMASSQLAAYVKEFDADGDGEIDLTEFSNLMSKLHGRLGITTNPTMLAKDLQLTVRKLEQLVGASTQKANEALGALVAEAKLDAPKISASALAEAARDHHAGQPAGQPPGQALEVAAGYAAKAAAKAHAHELAAMAAKVSGVQLAPAGEEEGTSTAAASAGGEGAASRSTGGHAARRRGGGGGRISPPKDSSHELGCCTSSSVGGGESSRADSSRPTSGHRHGGSPGRRAERGRSADHRRRRRGGGGGGGGGSRSPNNRSPHDRSRERGGGGRAKAPNSKSKPGRSRRGGGGFDDSHDLGPLKVAATATAAAAADSRASHPGDGGKEVKQQLAGAGDMRVGGTGRSPPAKAPRKPRGTLGSPEVVGGSGQRRRGQSASPTSPGAKTLMC